MNTNKKPHEHPTDYDYSELFQIHKQKLNLVILPSCEGGEMPKAWGCCSLLFEINQYAVTKEQPPPRYARSPPSQEGSLKKLYDTRNADQMETTQNNRNQLDVHGVSY